METLRDRTDATIMLSLLPSSRWPKSSIHSGIVQPVTARLPKWVKVAAVWSVLAATILFFRLGTFRTLGSHEIYAAVPAREMIESGNWVLPRFGGLPRLRKPPLVYWLVAGSATIFGELNPLTARLPSATAAILLCGLMGVWAGRWYGPRIGWAAAFVQLTTIWFVMFARKAEIDMVLCLLTTSALFLFANQSENESRRRSSWRWLGIYALLSIAWLAKFHYGPAMVIGPMFAACLIEKNWSRVRGAIHPLGILLGLAAVFLWPILILGEVPDAWMVWRRETLGRAVGEMGRHHLLFYVPFLLWLPMPWLPFAMAMLKQSWQSAWKNRNARERFLWVWVLAQSGILLLSANKHKHYLLAMLPVFTILAARGLVRTLDAFQSGRLEIPCKWLQRLFVGNLLFGVAITLTVSHIWPELTGPAIILGMTFGLLEGYGWWLLADRRMSGVMAVNVLTVLIVSITVMEGILPHFDRRVQVKAFAEDIRENVLPNDPVYVFQMDRDPLVYHLGSPVYRRESLPELKPTLEQHGELFVVGYEHQLRELHPFAETSLMARLAQGENNQEPVEGDLLLVRVTTRRLDTANLLVPNAN